MNINDGVLGREVLDSIVEEVAGYSVNLVEDPTLPEYGSAYIQKTLSICRNYSNRVVFYLQKVSSSVRCLRRDLTQRELDLEFKLSEKLADDWIVRKQASIADRKAVAISMFKPEYEAISDLKIKILDTEEILKIIKLKYTDLKQTSNDLRLQRQIIKDDKEAFGGTGEGYMKPSAKQDRSIPDGLVQPAVNVAKAPEEILNPNIPAENIPAPLDETKAKLMSDFLQEQPTPSEKSSKDINIFYSNLLDD
jgi:hypothetical protein